MAEAGPSRLFIGSDDSKDRGRRRRHPGRRVQKRTGTRPRGNAAILLATGLTALAACMREGVSAQSVTARWGQASALVGDQWLIHGGKTDGGGGFTYTSGPNTNELLRLNLSTAFQGDAAPWTIVNTTQSLSFHTLTPLDTSNVLVFGGDASSQLAIQTGNDSAWTLGLSDYSWTAPTSASQPMRRIHHAAEVNATSGQVWIVGGEKDDGSGILMDELWSYEGNSSFSTLATPPESVSVGLVEATTTLLSDGTLLVLGGMTANQTLAALDTGLVSYSTKNGQWRTTNATTASSSSSSTTSAVPSARMGHVAVSLPDQRVFIHGGSSVDRTQVFSDAWILDWSETPPVWSNVTMSNGPSARFSHAAVAYGYEITMAFGYTGNAAADTTVYTFDISNMTKNSAGAWSGGQWSTSYAAILAASSGSTSKSSTSNKDDGNSSSSSQGESGSSKGGKSKGSSSSSSSSDSGKSSSGGSFGSTSSTKSTGSGKPDDGNGSGSGDSSSSTSGKTAGAVLGSLIALGAVAGAGYAYFRHQQKQQLYGWRHGDGADDLLPGRYDDPFMAEKGIALHSVAVGGAGGAAGAGGLANIGTRPGGPRPMSTNNLSPWTPGHAQEGSGPHLKQRLALLTTGFGYRSGQPQHQQRFDMLADEDDDDNLHGIAEEEEDIGGDDHGPLDEDDYNYGQSYGTGGVEAYGRVQREEYETSPFEEEDTDSSQRPGSYESRRDYADSQSHSLQAQQQQQQSTSFSDAQHNSALIRRSPTWWDRFMNQSFLERSASGRLLPGPRAEEPIRDPARPPELSVIRESPRSADPSWGYDPFADRRDYSDDLGRDFGVQDERLGVHGRSQSSLKTTTSSVLENRLRNMDVIQRVRTGSSFDQGAFTDMTPTTESHSTIPTSQESTPGTVVWDGGAEIDDAHGNAAADTSLDIADLDMTPMPMHEKTPSLTPSTTKRARNNPEMTSPLSPQQKRQRPAPTRGSVKDRVKAIERKRTLEGEELLPVPRLPPPSPSASAASSSTPEDQQFVPGRGGRPILTKLSPSAHSVASPTKLTDSPARYSHGLVPKAQLFVANPDDRRRNSSGNS